jgi:fumarylpyruvate hydrolase
MSDFVFPPPRQPSVAISGSMQRFAVRRIFCVGRNYADHAREMGKDPDREPPFFFMKPADSLVDDGATIPYPPQTNNLHHEAELVVALGQGGVNLPLARALDQVFGYAIGNDLTRRDLQAQAKDMAHPWDLAKGFDNSAICGPVRPVSQGGHVPGGAIQLWVNDVLKQDGDISAMIWSVPEIIVALSQTVELKRGDLIYTGTPAGVGKLERGDTCRVRIAGIGELTTHIGA